MSVPEQVNFSLHQADCLDILSAMPGGVIDLIFADPPFNQKKNYQDGFNDNKPLAEYRAWLAARLEQMARVLRVGGTLWLMQDQRHLAFCQMVLEGQGLEFRNIVAWAYANPTPTRNCLPHTWRPILLMSKGDPEFFDWRADQMEKETVYHNPSRAKTHYPHDLWPDIPKLVGGYLAPPEVIFNNEGRFAHPVQMPVRLVERILKIASQPGDTVCDPFMGSGTVGDACLRLGRRFIGVEISSSYVELARQRLEKIVSGDVR